MFISPVITYLCMNIWPEYVLECIMFDLIVHNNPVGTRIQHSIGSGAKF